MDEINSRRRLLMNRSLRKFSDSCSPPMELHQSCPYRVRAATGFVCGEECMDILGEDEVSVVELDEPLGFQFHRMEPRRMRVGPKPDEIAFDAARSNAQDESKPVAQCTTTTLISRLRDVLVDNVMSIDSFSDVHSIDLTDLALELVERGFDVHELLNEVVVPELAFASVMRLFLPVMEANAAPQSLSNAALSELEWLSSGFSELRETIEGVLAAKSESIQRLPLILHEHLLEQYTGWFRSKSDEEILRGVLPNRFERFERPEEPIESQRGRWVFDRFTTTYLDLWQTPSLLEEWRYVRGECSTPCLSSHMQERKILAADLSREIANRAATGTLTTTPASASIGRYVQPAIELLTLGNLDAAISIFDVLCDVAPMSAEAFNNRGFCRLPKNPVDALRDFERACKLGMAQSPITIANRVLALRKLNRASSALALAEEEWDGLQSGGSCFLWNFATDVPVVIEVEDPVQYLVSLVTLIADESCDDVAASVWRSRSRV